MSAVEIEDVVKTYGAAQVIHGVSLSITDGEFLVLVGPSGCGKSTLLRMVAGLEDISGGTISIGGTVVNDLAPKERNIAMVFQNYALYPHMTVAENMAFSLRLARVPRVEMREKVDRAAAILGLQRSPRPLPRAALRRAAAAGGDGPSDRPQPGGLPVRRAAVEPRRQAPGADADRDQRAAPAARDDHDLRHPRPDRSDDHGRPHRGDERRPGGAGGEPARALRHAAEPVRRGLHRQPGDELPARAGRGRPVRIADRDHCGAAAGRPPRRRRDVVGGVRPDQLVARRGGRAGRGRRGRADRARRRWWYSGSATCRSTR